MANEENLIPINKRAKSVQREIQSKGGQAKADKERKKRLLKDCMLELLELPVAGNKNYNLLARMGLDPENIDNRSLLTVALFRKAVEGGDVNAFKEIRNLIGEDKTDNEDIMKKLDDVLGTIKGDK